MKLEIAKNHPPVQSLRLSSLIQKYLLVYSYVAMDATFSSSILTGPQPRSVHTTDNAH